MSPDRALALFTAFHANLDFSAMPAVDVSLVVERCYWPLLDLARSGLPLGIEMPARTLEILAETDPEWLKALRDEIEGGRVEVLGSGHAQVVAPLVPVEVNRANLRIGAEAYRALLGARPETWFVNEQTYSQGLADLYLEVGARQILMEWNNPASAQPGLRALRTTPARLLGSRGDLGVLWNDSIVFQRIQQAVHALRPCEDVHALISDIATRWNGGVLCVYGGDLEIFDYRPGQAPGAHGEARESTALRGLLQSLAEAYPFVLPGAAAEPAQGARVVELCCATDPMPCKKQPRYNPTRWAVSGRDGLGMNTRCHALYRTQRVARALGASVSPTRWRSLVELWRSDFRTRATEEKIEAFSEQMGAEQARARDTLETAVPALPGGSDLWLGNPWPTRWIDAPVEVELRFPKGQFRDFDLEIVGTRGSATLCAWQSEAVERYRDGSLRRTFALVDAELAPGGELALRAVPRHHRPSSLPGLRCELETDQVHAVFNFARGAALRSLSFPAIESRRLAGSIDHGHFLEIAHSPDFYSGHVVAYGEDGQKVTDLAPVEDARMVSAGPVRITFETRVPTPFGEWRKHWRLYRRCPRLDLRHDLRFPGLRLTSLRVGALTLDPDALRRRDFWYATVQGGNRTESFHLPPAASIEQGRAISSAVSATSCLGASDGWCAIGDTARGVLSVSDPALGAAVPMLNACDVDDSLFCRLEYSAAERDETRATYLRGVRSFSFAWLGFAGDSTTARNIAAHIAHGLPVRTQRGAGIARAL